MAHEHSRDIYYHTYVRQSESAVSRQLFSRHRIMHPSQTGRPRSCAKASTNWLRPELSKASLVTMSLSEPTTYDVDNATNGWLRGERSRHSKQMGLCVAPHRIAHKLRAYIMLERPVLVAHLHQISQAAAQRIRTFVDEFLRADTRERAKIEWCALHSTRHAQPSRP